MQRVRKNLKGLGLRVLVCVQDAEFEVELEDLGVVRTPHPPVTETVRKPLRGLGMEGE